MLKESGERRIIDFSEISRGFFNDLKYYDSKLSLKDRDAIDTLIGVLYDDFLSSGMLWTKTRTAVNPVDYLDKISRIAARHPKPEHAILDVAGRVYEHLCDHVELPTWMIISMSRRKTLLYIEMGEDFRIQEWRKDHGHEYRDAINKGW